MRWLLVAAVAAEAAAVPADRPDVLDVLITGVGKVNAAAAVAHRLAGEKPADVGVLNLGMAGGLRTGVTGIVRPSTVWAWDFDTPSLRALGIDISDTLELAGGDGSVIACGDTFVAAAALRARLAARASVVDMESYAVAQAAARNGFETRAVKWVSDSADEAAYDDFTAVLRHGASELGRYVSAFLDSAA
jgi:adenosylhomocysteine nucleosidase